MLMYGTATWPPFNCLEHQYMAVVTLREKTQNDDYLYRFKTSFNSFAKTSKE